MKRAFITGITGQDGSYLAELLLEKGYEVHGFVRKESWLKQHSISHLKNEIAVHFGDIAESIDIESALTKAAPKEIYNLASQSSPRESWVRALETLTINGMGAVRVFEAARRVCPQARIYHASSSEMFGQSKEVSQDEKTAFNPSNPYAASKVYDHQMAHIYRESHQMYISCGILFNHESERRPLGFVAQKVAYGAACAVLKIKNSPDLNERGHPIVANGKLALGNLDVARDWGHARDFVRAMWLMLQYGQPDDFVVGTGNLHTLRELCEVAYGCVGLDWKDSVYSDADFFRPLETWQTLANASKAERTLNWKPLISFDEMLQRMVQAQVERLKHILIL